jgi:2-polyprenyl-6-hydroxyphenyl methylase / 3-demethylubiquinone-9 3-methyltransferase
MQAINNRIYDDADLDWWQEDGFMAVLKNAVNPPRFDYFRHILTRRLQLDPKSLSVLDVGCGGGLLSEQFAGLGCQVTGVDQSAVALRAAQEHAAAGNLLIHYVHASGERLPFPDAVFDVVCCCDVLEHVDDIGIVIAEISRVLKPGGIFFYDTINRTLLSKIVAIKIAQDWAPTRFAPRDVHVWDKFIRPDELAHCLHNHAMQNRESVGLSAAANPLSALFALIQKKLGRISYAQLGRRLVLKESGNLGIAYMGYAARLV